MKRAIVSVINDLSTDQRVHKHCMLLQELGYDVLLIGRTTSVSVPMVERPYRTHRMRLPFETGPLFYASYNFALFSHLLFRKADLLFANDLDTLLPNYVVSRIKNKPLIYDSHEFFTEVPELVNRPRVQGIWKWLERTILPKLKFILTVNHSIAELYRMAYGVQIRVLRNVPVSQQVVITKSRQDLGLPTDKKVIILQGSGINVDRGAEEALQAMTDVNDAVLLILGSGDVIEHLKKMASELNVESKVIFKGRMPYDEMMAHTRVSDLGLTLDKNTNINYRFSLPNKLFDYIHAEIPILASNLEEVSRVVKGYEVGEVLEEVTPTQVARKINAMLQSAGIPVWKENCKQAKRELNWETESSVLKEIITTVNG